jgi:hypothetical protein
MEISLRKRVSLQVISFEGGADFCVQTRNSALVHAIEWLRRVLAWWSDSDMLP